MLNIKKACPLTILAAIAAGALATTASLREAKAQVTTPYYFSDNFDTPSDWSPWVTGTHAEAVIDYDSGAYQGPGNDLMLYFEAGGTTSDFALVDKEFDLDDYPLGTPPSGTPSNCYAEVYIKPNLGAKGSLQMIDADTLAYIGSWSFNFSASNTWTDHVVHNSATCTRKIIVRIGMQSTTHAQMLHADFTRVVFNFP